MDAFLTIDAVARLRSIRALALGGALLAVSLVAPTATVADEGTFDPPTANERSIAMTESKEPSSASAFVPMTQNERSIALTESKEAPAGVGADWTSLASGQTANERSIALIEGSDPANVATTASDLDGEVVITRLPSSWDL